MHKLSIEARQLEQGALLGPHGLDDHLGEFHSQERGVQVAVRTDDIDHGVDELDGLLKDHALVEPQVNVQWLAVEVALEQQIALGLRCVELVRLQWVAILGAATVKDGVSGELGKLAEQRLLTVTDRHRCKLCGLAQYSDHSLHLLGEHLLVLELPREQTNRLVLDAVESCDFAEVHCFNVHFGFLVDADALGLLQVLNRLFHQLRQEVIDVLGCSAAQIVIVRIRGESSVQEGPCHPIDSVLLRSDCSNNDLRVQAIVQV